PPDFGGYRLTRSTTTATTQRPPPRCERGDLDPRSTPARGGSDGTRWHAPPPRALPALRWMPPQAPPAAKSYLQFNTSWPANSWAVTENANGYQARYILTLARYAR